MTSKLKTQTTNTMAGTDNKNTGNTTTTTTTTMDLKRKAVDDDVTSKSTDGDRSPTSKKRAATSDGVSAIATAAAATTAVVDAHVETDGTTPAVPTTTTTTTATSTTSTTIAATAATLSPIAAAYKANTNGYGRNELPILVILPGSSGKLSKDFKEFLLPELHQRFDVRLRDEKKWKGWDPRKNAIDVCSREENLVTTEFWSYDHEDEDWYIMGCSFGNRVATAVVAELDERQRVPPKLILTGYPMYGPSLNNKDARVRSLQSLPVGTPVLAISGTKDEFINSEKNVPDQLPSGNPRAVWDSVLQTMPCRASTTVRLIEKGGHGVYPAAKGRKATTTTQLVQYIDTFVMGNNGDVPSRQSIRDADIEAYIAA